jgi:hypothetical protein
MFVIAGGGGSGFLSHSNRFRCEGTLPLSV